MKVLFLSHIPIFATVGGDQIRIQQTLRFLLEKHDVDVIDFSSSDSTSSIKDVEPRIGTEWRFRLSFWKKLRQISRTLTNKYPSVANFYYSPKIQAFINKIASKYDILVCSSVGTALYAKNAPIPSKYIDLTDSLTLNYTHAAANSKGICRFFKKLDAKRMRKFEQQCADIAKRTLYISEHDRHYVGIPSQKTAYVPNYVEVPATDIQRKPSTSPKFIFIGKMNYEPNITAAHFFATEVLPKLPKDSQFIIVGAEPDTRVLNLQNNPQVKVTGFVESLQPYFENATLIVAPMISGSGVQNKILQAMAHGMCVVTTPIGAEGVEEISEGLVISGKDSDTIANELAKSINDLIACPNLVEEIGQKARQLVSAKFDYSTVRQMFFNALN